jgi:hypothetical protein
VDRFLVASATSDVVLNADDQVLWLLYRELYAREVVPLTDVLDAPTAEHSSLSVGAVFA